MAYKLVGQNMAAQITLRGPQDGTPTALGTPTAFNMSLVRSIETSETANTADVAGLGDVVDIVQVLRTAREVTIELFVPETGAMFKGKIGYYVQVDLKDLASLSSFDSYDGVITGYMRSYPDGAQTEKLTIRGAANGL